MKYFFAVVAMFSVFYVKIKGTEDRNGYPVNRWNCTYPCYYGDDVEKCRLLCRETFGADYGYCYWNACYCENLPDNVKRIKTQGMFGCSHGWWVVSTTTRKPQ
nr:putative NaTx Tcis52 [Tityus cisandinus]